MQRTKFLMLCALAVACAGFLTTNQPTDPAPLDRHAYFAAALVTTR